MDARRNNIFSPGTFEGRRKKNFLAALKKGRYDITFKMLRSDIHLADMCLTINEIKKLNCKICESNHYSHLLYLKKYYLGYDQNDKDFAESSLNHACFNGDIKLIEELLNTGIKYICSGMFYACLNNQIKTLKFFIDHFSKNKIYLEQALFGACKSGNIKIVKFLINFDTKLKSEISEALKFACLSGNLKLIKYLISLGADIYYSNQLAFKNACTLSNTDVVNYLLKLGIDISNPSSHILKSACQSGNLKLVKHLLKHGAKIDGSEGEFFLKTKNNVKIIKYLISKGFSLSKFGHKTLLNACQIGDLKLVNTLINMGLDIHHNNDEVLTKADESLILYLLDKGIDIHANQDSALIYACENGTFKSIQLLLNRGADVNAQNSLPLIKACYRKDLSINILKLLCNYGSNIYVNNFEPFKILCESSSFDCVKFMLTQDSKNLFNQALIDEGAFLAYRNSNFEVANSLIMQKNASKDFITELEILRESKNIYSFSGKFDFLLSYHSNVIKYNLPKNVIMQACIFSKDSISMSHKFILYHLLDSELLNEALALACDEGFIGHVIQLIKLGANVNFNEGEYLIKACRYGNYFLAKILLENNANPNAKFFYHPAKGFMSQKGADLQNEISKRSYALNHTVMSGNVPIAKLLINYGANVNANSDEALIEASKLGNIHMIKLLLKNGSDIHARNDEALVVAHNNNQFKAVRFLLKHGAKIRPEYECAIGNLKFSEQLLKIGIL